MDSFKDIELAFKKRFSNKKILSVINYDAKDIYVIRAIPENVKTGVGWEDGMYSMDRNSLAVIGGFNPLVNDPDIFFNLPPSAIIYKGEA